MKRQNSSFVIVKIFSFFVPYILSHFLSEGTSILIFSILAFFILSVEYETKEQVDAIRAFPLFIPLLIFAALSFYSAMYDNPVYLNTIDCAVLCYTSLYSIILLFIHATNTD